MTPGSVVVLSADNGGICTDNGGEGGGYNYPYRGQKATMWEGGMRAVGFVHSPLLPRRGFVYNGLVHVSDWFPTLLTLASNATGGGRPLPEGLDGHDVWRARPALWLLLVGGRARGHTGTLVDNARTQTHTRTTHLVEMPCGVQWTSCCGCGMSPHNVYTDGLGIAALSAQALSGNVVPSPRSELLHNIDIFGGLGASGFGNAAIRVGDLKLLILRSGADRKNDVHFVPPGCDPTSICRVPAPPPALGPCEPDTAETTEWLFDISRDPFETCNLHSSRPADVARLKARLLAHNQTQVPVIYPKGDPAAAPSKRRGVEKGSWGPWRR